MSSEVPTRHEVLFQGRCWRKSWKGRGCFEEVRGQSGLGLEARRCRHANGASKDAHGTNGEEKKYTRCRVFFQKGSFGMVDINWLMAL